MSLSVSFQAKGHPNIRSTHKTTFMTTKEEELSPRGDCIIVVSAGMALHDLPPEVKEMAKNPDTEITFRMEVDGHVFEAKGTGHPNLEYTNPVDMVARRSTYTCGRTLMVNSDKASCDIPEEIINALQNPNAVADLTIYYDKKP